MRRVMQLTEPPVLQSLLLVARLRGLGHLDANPGFETRLD